MGWLPTRKLKFGFLKKTSRLFARVKGRINHLIEEGLKSPLSWRSIIWDSNIADEFPDHAMRTFRYVIGLTYFTHLIGLMSVGIFLLIDGAYSIYRNRFEIALTQHWADDMPRLARSLLGVVLIATSAGLF